MERLTTKDKKGNVRYRLDALKPGDNPQKMGKEKLFAYEETGRDPEEIQEMTDTVETLRARLQSFVDADNNGCMLILPLKIHEKVYAMIDNAVYEANVTGYRLHEWGTLDVMLLIDTPKLSGSYLFDVKLLGVSLFRTREEAIKRQAKSENQQLTRGTDDGD